MGLLCIIVFNKRKLLIIMKCKLCKKDKPLKNSHILPKHIYKMLNEDNKGYLLYEGDKNLVQLTQRQITKKLLCYDCEQLLGVVETKVANSIHYINQTDYSDRVNFANNIPGNDELTSFRQMLFDGLNDKQRKVHSFFNIEKFNDIKYYGLSILLRQYYYLENSMLPIEIVERLEKYIYLKESFKVQMTVFINNNIKDYPMGSFPYTISKDQFFHTQIILPNIFLYIHFRRDNSIEHDNFTILPDDFYNLDKSALPAIESIKYFKKNLHQARKAKNTQNYFNSEKQALF